MVKRSIQGYVELASGLGELTRAKAVEAAQEIIALGSSDASRKKVAEQASRLADDLLTAAEENRRQLVALVQREVEGAMERLDIARHLAEAQALAGTVSALAAQVDDLARAVTGRSVEVAAAGMTVTSGEPAGSARPSQATPTPASAAGSGATATKPAAKKSTATKSAAKKSTAKRSAAKKSTATKSAAKKSTATKSPATKASSGSAAKKSTATKSAAKKSPATKASSGSAAKKSTAKKSAAKKSTARATSSGSTSATPSASTSAPSAEGSS